MGRKPTFSYDVELELADQVLKLAKFEYSEANHIPHRFNKYSKITGPDWLQLFMKRHPNISLRKPEGTSLNRVTSFNETNVKKIFENLEECLNKYELHVKADKIYNVDETGITTVQKPSKNLGPKGQKQVGSLISWERVKNATVCCMNAAGSFVPPMFIYPRARMNNLLEKDGPVEYLDLYTHVPKMVGLTVNYF